MNPRPSNITTVQLLAVDTGKMPHNEGLEPAIQDASLSPPTSNQHGKYSQRQTGVSSSTDHDFTVHSPSQSLSIRSNHTDCNVGFTSVVQKSKLLQILLPLIV